ncbi:MAG: putative bifunctional diguanylate cyclase/phosphodiesterase [Bacillota bacterium]
MHIKSQLFHKNFLKKSILFSVLTALALWGKISGIQIIFDMDFMASSFLFLLILKLFGLKGALFAAATTNAIEYTFINQGLEPVLSFLEIAVVGLIYERKQKYLIIWDALYWISLGSLTISIAYYSSFRQIGIETYSLMFMYSVNGIFNAVLADVFTTYFSIEKLYGNKDGPKKYPTIATFLIHLSIAGILGPFIVYTVLNSWSYEKTIEAKAFEISKTASSKIREQVSKWSHEDLRALKLKSVIHLGYIEDLIKISTLTSPLNIQLLDSNSTILASSRLSGEEAFLSLREEGELKYIKDSFARWFPNISAAPITDDNWNKALYIYETELYNFKMIVMVPIMSYRTEYFNNYLFQVRIVILFSLLITVIILIINRFVLRFLSRLMKVSTGLTSKLRLGQEVSWPESNIYELKALTSNFRVMSEDLTDMITEYQTMYEELERKTNQLIKSEQKLHQLAYYDMVTGLPNRFSFTKHLKAMLEDNSPEGKKINEPTAVILIDLDRFKQVNDTLGHAAGDLLLNAVANRVNKVLVSLGDDNCFFARLGGDEFVIALNGLNIREVKQITQSVINTLKKPFCLEEREVFIGGSLGISIYPDDAESMIEIVKNADMAMYAAKEHGGNTYCFYSEINSLGIPERMKLENGMHRALERGEFLLYYQPKFDAKTGMITGAEALIRWMNPEDGLILPEQFIKLAEETGLIIPIGEWVLREALMQIKAWQKTGYSNISVSVNCSPLQFKQNDMAALIESILKDTGVGPEYLELEITESFIIENKEHVINELTKIRNMGVNISVDDFGMGYSSLSALKGLPITGLKLDKTFVSNIPFDRHNVAVIKSVLRLARDIRLRVTAEGVETAESMDCLRKMGCDELQGYFFSKPIPSEEFLRFLKTGVKPIKLDFRDSKL